MERDQAEQSLAAARAAQVASGRPVMPVMVSFISALAAGIGVALFGQSPNQGWLRALCVAGGVALLAAAFLVPATQRRRLGLHGFRGRVRSDNAVFLICAVALLVTGLNANRALGVIYLGIGTFVAIAYFLLLRGRFGRSA